MSVEVLLDFIVSRTRQDAHAESHTDPNTGKLAYHPVNKAIQPSQYAAHRKGAPILGIYFLAPGSSDTCVAALDLDDKESALGMEGMQNIAKNLYDGLKAKGYFPMLEQSGSGKGIHIWLIFDKPQPAGRIRSMLINALEEQGLEEGTKGVVKKQVEIYPRQDRLKEGDEYGNLIALPYNRKSAMLTPAFKPIPEDKLRLISSQLSPDIEDKHCEIKSKAKGDGKKGRSKEDKEKPPTFEEVSQCLNMIPNDDCSYEEWRNLLYAVHHATDGSDEGYELFASWSEKSEKHDIKELDKCWFHTRDKDEGGITWKTLFAIAREHGWTRFQDLINQYVYVGGHDEFYSLETGTAFTIGAMSRMFKAHHNDMANYLLAQETFPKVERLTFWPGQPRILVEDDMRKYNTWKDPNIESQEGDPSIFLRHMELLIPDEMERNHVLDFLAFMVQRPGEKIRHALVIQGEQGIGKSFLQRVMKRVLGDGWVKPVNNNTIKGDFNGWAVGTTLIVVEELKVPDSMEFSNVLKTIISEEEIQINDKHEKHYTVKNRSNIIMFTNFEDALQLEQGDRRHFIYFSPMLTQEPEYYDRLWEWTEISGPILKHYFLHRDISKFKHTAPPPMTEAKRQVLHTSKSNVQLKLERLIEAKAPLLAKDVVHIASIRQAFASDGAGEKPPSEKAIMNNLRYIGCFEVEVAGTKAWVIRNFSRWKSATKEEIEKEYATKTVVQGGRVDALPSAAKEAF